MMALNFQPETVKKHMLRTPPRRTNTTAVVRQDVKKLLLLGDQIMQQDHGDLYPEGIYAVDWSQHVPRSDVLHMGAIQRACVAHPESAISWTFGRGGNTDPSGESIVNRTVDGHADNNERLLEALRKCPDVDIFVPVGIRGQGYCEDAAAYTKYLHGRIVSRWIFEIRLFDKTLNREVSYHELCPSTPMLFLQHYWDGLRDEPDWPATKPLYVMPNIEMSELEPRHLMQADVVLCKTAICAQYIAMWFEQEGNPRMAQVLYTRFTSSDMATNALAAAGLESLESNWQVRATKDFKSPMFVHTAGGSSEKGSRWILDCWLSRPDLPQLDFYMGETLYNQYYKKRYEERILQTTNIKVHVSSIDAVTFGRMIADTAFFLCTSYMEGYGHYINHARAAGGLIITPDVPPMNELISSTSGVLLDAKRGYLKRLFLGGDSDDPKGLRNVPGFTALFDGKEICQAVDRVLQELSAGERQRRAMRARQNFFYDTAVFAMKMRELHTMLRPAAPATYAGYTVHLPLTPGNLQSGALRVAQRKVERSGPIVASNGHSFIPSRCTASQSALQAPVACSMAPKKSFYSKWQSDHARRAWLTPTNILFALTIVGGALMLLQFSLLGGGKNWPKNESYYAQQTIEEQGEVYPDHVFDSKWAAPVPLEDRLHLALLHEACLTHKDSVIPFSYGKGGKIASPSGIINRDDPDLIDKIRQCPDVDIFLPVGIRGHGYCEDSIAYTKYMESRMLPAWAVEITYVDKTTGKSLSYHDLCPTTPMIFLNHYWDGIPDKPEWPAAKPKYLMPNIEMFELTAHHYWNVDVVLCKTAICARRVRAFYQQEGNPKNTMVFYTRHTTSDVATLARHRLGDDVVQPKNYSNVKFVHAVGTSLQKGTKHVLECWLSRTDLPKLDIYVNKDVYDGALKERFGSDIQKASKRLQMHFERVDANAFGKLTAENSFFMCTSFQEGYGHYINQARATSAVIITTDLPPMDELLSPQSGVMVPVKRWSMRGQLLGGHYDKDHGLTGVQGMTADMHSDNICAAVDTVMAMTPRERQAMGERAKMQYDIDTNFFAAKMLEVRAFAKQRRRAIRTVAP